MEDDPDRRPREIKFTTGQTFYKRRHFHNALNELSIVKTLSSNILKSDNPRVRGRCRCENCTWLMRASINKVAKIFTLRKFFNKLTYSIPGVEKTHRQAKSLWIATTMKDQIYRQFGAILVKTRTYIQRDFSVDVGCYMS